MEATFKLRRMGAFAWVLALWAAGLAGCGGGGSESSGGGELPLTTLKLDNAALRMHGGFNTLHIVGITCRSAFGGTEFHLPPLDVSPGESLVLYVPPGIFNFVATYSDGSTELLQSPGDPARIFSNAENQLLFMR